MKIASGIRTRFLESEVWQLCSPMQALLGSCLR